MRFPGIPVVLDALNATERRGVVIRVVLDPRSVRNTTRRQSAPTARAAYVTLTDFGFKELEYVLAGPT